MGRSKQHPQPVQVAYGGSTAKQAPYVLLNVVFKVFEDGVGFRYEFPAQAAFHYFIISNELTQFNLTGNHTTFWILGDYDYKSRLSDVDAAAILMLSYGNPKENTPDNKAVHMKQEGATAGIAAITVVYLCLWGRNVLYTAEIRSVICRMTG